MDKKYCVIEFQEGSDDGFVVGYELTYKQAEMLVNITPFGFEREIFEQKEVEKQTGPL
jgi:hypothetical protein